MIHEKYRIITGKEKDGVFQIGPRFKYYEAAE